MIGTSSNSLADVLLRSRNIDGGWGYYPAKESRIESTCWAALCLSRADESRKDLADAAVRWLVSRLRANGFLDDATGEMPNMAFNALGALVLRRTETWSPELQRLLAALNRTKGLAIENGAN